MKLNGKIMNFFLLHLIFEYLLEMDIAWFLAINDVNDKEEHTIAGEKLHILRKCLHDVKLNIIYE